MESFIKVWNKQQTESKGILLIFDQYDQAISLFLGQHAGLHSADMADTKGWSIEDEIMDNISYQTARFMPSNEVHSIPRLQFQSEPI